MKPFRTEYQASPRRPLGVYGGVLLLGSCFADEVGARLQNALVPATVNPAGPLFNPCSIARALAIASGEAEPRMFAKADSTLCWDCAAAADPSDAFRSIATALNKASVLVITLGTAIVYEHEGTVVANCHKMPSAMFTRRMLSVDEVADALRPAITAFLAREGRRVVLTVSPVRHLKEGFEENSLSKATLRLAADRLCRDTGAEYFPAYEIVCDDLRDYRFYGADMQHPSPLAVDYVWSKFGEMYFDEATRALVDEGESLSRRLSHRPLHPDSVEAKQFKAETQRLLDAFLKKI